MKLPDVDLNDLEKSAEDALDLMINNVCIGRGEVVKIGENFGLQVSEVGTPEEILRKMAKGGAASGTF